MSCQLNTDFYLSQDRLLIDIQIKAKSYSYIKLEKHSGRIDYYRNFQSSVSICMSNVTISQFLRSPSPAYLGYWIQQSSLLPI